MTCQDKTRRLTYLEEPPMGCVSCVVRDTRFRVRPRWLLSGRAMFQMSTG